MSDKYNSWLARLFGILNRVKGGYAVTISKSTTLYSCPKNQVSDEWRREEDWHKEQIRVRGWLMFMIKYLVRMKNDGYDKNSFEVEAKGKR